MPGILTKTEPPKSLSGPQKAAVLMLALGESQAANLIKRMEKDEISRLSLNMATLGRVDSQVVEALFLEFVETIKGTGALVGTYESTERLLSKVLDHEQVQQIMEEIRGPSGRTMWDKLSNVNEGVLANYLKNEYPQTVAVVLAKIKPAHASRVLSLLPENFAIEVVMRMLRMESVQKEILDHVERTLRTEFITNLSRSQRRDSHEVMAEIFNNFDRMTESRFMAALEERNPASAERIKNLMFTFEDLQRIDGGGIQLLLRQVPKEKLAVALKNASDVMKDLFLRNMSERAAKMLKEDIAALPPMRVRDVDEAQAAIVATARALAEANEITIAGSGDQDEALI
jgi:flagellar motor switch protein FliG